MARQGITFEQVAAVADALAGEGQQPTIRAVRERLGDTGSPNTIHKHLAAWREARPVAAAAAPPKRRMSVVSARVLTSSASPRLSGGHRMSVPHMAVTSLRLASVTPPRIAPASAPGFIAAQLLGAAIAVGLAVLLYPRTVTVVAETPGDPDEPGTLTDAAAHVEPETQPDGAQ